MKNDDFTLRVSETVPDRSGTSSQERTCDECGKSFHISRLDMWAYKISIKGKTSWFCRWNCLRAGEKKLKNAKAGRKKELKANKPKKEALEKDLRSGMSLAKIAEKYGCSIATINNWTKEYGLQGVKGVPKPSSDMKPEVKSPVNDDPELSRDSTLSSKPSREKLEDHLRAGATIENIAKRYEASVQSVHNWIGAYGLVGIQGVKQKDEEIAQDTQPVADMVQESPTLVEIEQIHTDTEVQEFPKSELDPIPEPQVVRSSDPVSEPRKPFEEVWQDLRDDINALKRVYVSEAEKSFNEQLRVLFLEVSG